MKLIDNFALLNSLKLGFFLHIFTLYLSDYILSFFGGGRKPRGDVSFLVKGSIKGPLSAIEGPPFPNFLIDRRGGALVNVHSSGR